MTSLRFVERLRDLVDGVEVILSDIWGVVHNGLESFPEACEALHTCRQHGATVILITNAPRPADSVQRQLRKLGVADETYDAIVSSGDLTRNFVADHPGKKMFWIGPERDSSIHRGLDAVMAPLEQADYIVCTGLFDDETESAEDYRATMLQARERKLTLVCANPDIVVERGDRLIYCAGAIAELYRELGGEVIFYGKPHRPIYQRAMELAAEQRGHPAELSRVLAIGDSVRTDLAGAHGFGIDARTWIDLDDEMCVGVDPFEFEHFALVGHVLVHREDGKGVVGECGNRRRKGECCHYGGASKREFHNVAHVNRT